MENKIYHEVSVTDRLPDKIGRFNTDKGFNFYVPNNESWVNGGGKIVKPQWWFEEITLEHIQDKRELTSTFLVNSIRLLDEQGARHLVNELCERFHLLPTKEEINKVRDSYSWSHIDPAFNSGWRFGIKHILESLKGKKDE